MGLALRMSAFTSAMAASWSGVSRYGNASSISICAGVSGPNAYPCALARRAYTSTKSNASFLVAALAFFMARDQSAVFRRVHRGVEPSGPT